MRKGELAKLREVIAVQQSQIEAWRKMLGTFLRMWEDERARADALEKTLRDLAKDLDPLSASPSR